MSVYGSQCFIEIYPYEGGTLNLQGGGHVLDVSVSRNIRQVAGSFTIALRPGGPGGVDSTPSWAEIITPMSLVLIGMRRGPYSAIVMVGVVTTISENQQWQANTRAARSTIITGQDFAYFFNNFNYYTLGVLGMTAGAIQGEGSPFAKAVSVPQVLSQGFLNGTPDQIGFNFYSQAMVGLLGNIALQAFVYVPYKNNGGKIYLNSAMSYLFQQYPNAYIPSNANFVLTEGSWTAKFLDLFPFPFYEFFVLTAPTNFYLESAGDAANYTFGPGYGFTMQSLPSAPMVSPNVVARVNPLPVMDITVSAPATGGTIGDVNMTAWNSLPLTIPDAAFITSQLTFSVDEVRNFYGLNPTAYRGLSFTSNAETSNFLFANTAAVDVASINRYGYRPELAALNWLYDSAGTSLENPKYVVEQTVASLESRLFSYHEPTPLMARASVIMNCRPDIFPGTRYRYSPFKNEPTWDFYVEGVSHNFSFAQASMTTTLELSRGLPTNVYSDTGADGILAAIHTGLGQRNNGIYSFAPAGTVGLVTFGRSNDISQWLGSLAPAFSTPQGP